MNGVRNEFILTGVGDCTRKCKLSFVVQVFFFYWCTISWVHDSTAKPGIQSNKVGDINGLKKFVTVLLMDPWSSVLQPVRRYIGSAAS